MKNYKQNISVLMQSAIQAVHPSTLIKNSIQFEENIIKIYNNEFDLSGIDNIYVVGAGKASGFMAEEIENLLGSTITAGIVSVFDKGEVNTNIIRLIEAGHPIPNENSLKAGKEIFNIASSAKENDLVICLLSGGGSALMELLAKEIKLEDYQKLTDLLIKSGADINEINKIRKSISVIKAGGLAKAVFPATCISLIISDVLGDDLKSIASSPTLIQNNIKKEALHIIDKYNLTNKISDEILNEIKNISDDSFTNKTDISKKTHNFIIGNIHKALAAIKLKAEELGYKTKIISENISGEAKSAAIKITKKLKQNIDTMESLCFLFGGETTVKVEGKGKGGRNQELVLASLLDLKNVSKDFVLASFGTDGRDGPTDSAGAFIDCLTWNKVKEMQLDPTTYLEENDSYYFFEKLGNHLKIGTTGTNVMDIQVVMIN